MRTVADLFDAFKGPSAVARLLGVGPSTASEMKRRGSVPVEYWPKLLDAAKEGDLEEITPEALIEMHSGNRRPAEAAELAEAAA